MGTNQNNWLHGTFVFKEVLSNVNAAFESNASQQVVMDYTSEEVAEVLNDARPQEEVNVWFTVRSIQTDPRQIVGGWETYLRIMRVEIPRLEQLNKDKAKVASSEGYDLDFEGVEDF